jgi:hypothetical protein
VKKTNKPIKILKKLTGSVRFRFHKPETEKTEPNPNRKKIKKKPSQTSFYLKKPNQIKTHRFESVLFFF